MATIENLPNELLVLIFEYMPIEDRKNARQVCQRWRHISLAPIFLCEEVTTVPDFKSLDLLDFTRNYYNISVKNSLKEGPVISSDGFWMNLGQHLQQLTVRCITLSELSPVITYIPNLARLTLIDVKADKCEKSSDQFLFPKLENLQVIGGLNSKNFMQLVANAPHLKQLHIEHFRDGSRTMVDYMKRQGNILEYLGLVKCDMLVTKEFLFKIAPSLGPQLKILNLKRATSLIDNSLSVITNYLPNLTEINLSGTLCSDMAYSNVVKYTKCLKRIELEDTDIADLTASVIEVQLPHLKALNVSICQSLPVPYLCYVLSEYFQYLELTELNLSQLAISGNNLDEILSHTPKMRHLSLEKCVMLTHLSVYYIARWCQNLRHLNISGIPGIRDIFRLSDCRKLTYLDVTNCSQVTFEELWLPNLRTFLFTFRDELTSDFENFVLTHPYLDKESRIPKR